MSYSFAEAQQYFEFLEDEFAKDDKDGSGGDPLPGAQKTENPWIDAAAAVKPTSRFGPLFGLTQKDINRARNLLEGGLPPLPKFQSAAKRLFDIVSSVICIILLLPIFVVLAAIIRSDSPGPVLYRQERIGRYGKTFMMLKFRTMEKVSLRSVRSYALEPGVRASRAGEWMRRFSLEDLPQLWNILKGEMSFVGPRPILAEEIRHRNELQRAGSPLRPGLTGLFHFAGESQRLRWKDLLRLDLYYMENWSLLGDVIIIARALPLRIKPARRRVVYRK